MSTATVSRVDRAGAPDGPLSDVDVAVKDMFDVAGAVTGAGNPWLAAQPPALVDAAAVAALSAGGATIAVKTATDELAMGMFGVNTHYGTPPNPAAPDRVPGGSSSGSASAVAAGEVALGLGTDTGGSIRVPAAFCGIVGLRPTHGRIDVAGVRPMAARFDTVGLLARDVATIRRAWPVLASPAGPAAPRAVRALVLLTDLVDVATAPVAEITRARAADWAASAGLELREECLVADPLPRDLREVFWPLMSRALWESNGAWFTTHQPTVGEGIGDRIIAAGRVSDDEVELAEQLRDTLVRRLAHLLAGAVAILPTAMDAAPLRSASHADLMGYRDRNLALVVPAPLTGAPQVTLPAGTVHDPVAGTDAPVGVSLLGLPGDDEMLLDLAARVAGA